MKKIFSLFFVLVLMSSLSLGLVSCSKNQSSINNKVVLNEGKAGTDITWTYYNDNTLVFDGTGEMFEYYDSTTYISNYPSLEMPWYEYSKIAKEIVLSEGITSISNFAFFGARGIKTINLPKSITKIGACSFEHSSIETITLPENLEVIEDYLFYHCHNLKEVVCSDQLKYIGDGAFDDCPKLELTEYDNAYYWGTKTNPHFALIKSKSTDIDSCDIHERTSIIYTSAFQGCINLSQIELGSNIKYIGKESFYRSGLEKIVIPDAVEYISYGAFRYCKNLKEITLGKAVNRIGVTAFDGCDNLARVYVYGDESNWNNIVFEMSSDGYGHYNWKIINATREYYND